MTAPQNRPPDPVPDSVPEGFTPMERGGGNFVSGLGPFYVDHSTTPARFGTLLTQAQTNIRGVIHGGMLLSLTDQMLGYTVVSALGDEPVATVSLKADFVRACMPGDWVTGTPEIIRLTRSIVFVRATLRCGGQVVLTADGIWKRLGR